MGFMILKFSISLSQNCPEGNESRVCEIIGPTELLIPSRTVAQFSTT